MSRSIKSVALQGRPFVAALVQGSASAGAAGGGFRHQASDTVPPVFGYRRIGFDCEDGSGGSSDCQRYELTGQGPLAGTACEFRPGPIGSRPAPGACVIRVLSVAAGCGENQP